MGTADRMVSYMEKRKFAKANAHEDPYRIVYDFLQWINCCASLKCFPSRQGAHSGLGGGSGTCRHVTGEAQQYTSEEQIADCEACGHRHGSAATAVDRRSR